MRLPRRLPPGLRSTLACTAALLVTCAAAPPAHATASGATLRVFAAASLADGFGDLAKRFETAHPGVRVQLNLAGSQQLASQIAMGAPADVFASADERWMDDAKKHGLLAGEPRLFARNRLVAIVPRTNPGRIARLQDLSRRGLKLVIGAEAVPVGRYAREVLRNLSREGGYPADFATRALANVVSEEENVKSVVGKVQLGEADAGFVYRSDVTPALARYVRVFELPPSANVLASYTIAALAGARDAALANAFVALVLSPEGQQVLERRGLIAASATTVP